MAISYEWDVSRVDTYPTHNSQTDVVYNVHWRLDATDDANTMKIWMVMTSLSLQVFMAVKQ